MVAMTLGGLSYRANTVAQPAYFAERVPQIGYGVATSMVYVVGTIGQYLGGRVADRYDLRILYLGFHLLSLPFVLAMSVLAGLSLLAAPPASCSSASACSRLKTAWSRDSPPTAGGAPASA